MWSIITKQLSNFGCQSSNAERYLWKSRVRFSIFTCKLFSNYFKNYFKSMYFTYMLYNIRVFIAKLARRWRWWDSIAFYHLKSHEPSAVCAVFNFLNFEFMRIWVLKVIYLNFILMNKINILYFWCKQDYFRYLHCSQGLLISLWSRTFFTFHCLIIIVDDFGGAG